jgi:hypothetical protein
VFHGHGELAACESVWHRRLGRLAALLEGVDEVEAVLERGCDVVDVTVSEQACQPPAEGWISLS